MREERERKEEEKGWEKGGEEGVRNRRGEKQKITSPIMAKCGMQEHMHSILFLAKFRFGRPNPILLPLWGEILPQYHVI